MALIDDIKRMAATVGAELEEERGAFALRVPVAERKGFMAKKRLVYQALFRLDDPAQVLYFSETLRERVSGMAGGTEAAAPLMGSIAEQSEFFGQRYCYRYDWGTIRDWMEQAAGEAGYRFEYYVTGETN